MSKVNIGNRKKFENLLTLKKGMALAGTLLVVGGFATGCSKNDTKNADNITNDYGLSSTFSACQLVFGIALQDGSIEDRYIDINSYDIDAFLKEGYHFNGYMYKDVNKDKLKKDMFLVDDSGQTYLVPFDELKNYLKSNVEIKGSITEKEDRAIFADELDYSNITVVMECNGGVSDKIVEKTAKALDNLRVKVYIDDKYCLDSVKEAMAENPYDDILVVRVGGEKNKTGKTVIMANYYDGIGCTPNSKNSDSLAAVISSELPNSKVVNGKLEPGYDVTYRGPTKIEKDLDKINVSGRSIKNVTVAIDDDFVNSTEIANAIVTGVVKYTAMSNEERNAAYYGMAGFVRSSKSYDKQAEDTIEVANLPKIKIDKNSIEKYMPNGIKEGVK